MEFVSRDAVLKQGKDIVPIMWAFHKKCHPSGEVYHFKECMCVHGDLQRDNYSNNETFAAFMEWATIRMLFCYQLLKGGLRLVLTSRTALLKPLYPSQLTLNFHQDVSKPIQEPRTSNENQEELIW